MAATASKTYVSIAALIVVMSFPVDALARPVSYPTGWTIMTNNDGEMNSLHVHYSPTARYSVGLKFEHDRDSERERTMLQTNLLLKRWNAPSSQANMYLKLGGGVINDQEEGTGFITYATDWETRRYFTSYQATVRAEGGERGFEQAGRIGITPYIGDYGDLHTWLMLEAHHDPEDSDRIWHVTPLIRFFKGPDLLETGYSFQGKYMLNYVHRF